MTESNFEFLPDMRLSADPRRIAAELNYVYFLMECQRGVISEENEQKYIHPVPEAFTYENGRRIAYGFLEWYVADPLHGLIGDANFSGARDAIRAFGSVLSRNEVLLASDLRPLQQKLQAAVYSHYDRSDETTEDNIVLDRCLMVCRDLLDEESDGIKSAITRDMSLPVYRKLGEVLLYS